RLMGKTITPNSTYGSGCTLSSAIAAFLARGEQLTAAVGLAQEYVTQAIAAGSDVRTGKGNGPLNHFFAPQALIKHEMV
ncbi:MAG: bifunctional hydroxymethylpyrimidine kinase/phosphomethylpyrimidine kinase, partial [Chitinophagaceae bacterium]